MGWGTKQILCFQIKRFKKRFFKACVWAFFLLAERRKLFFTQVQLTGWQFPCQKSKTHRERSGRRRPRCSRVCWWRCTGSPWGLPESDLRTRRGLAGYAWSDRVWFWDPSHLQCIPHVHGIYHHWKQLCSILTRSTHTNTQFIGSTKQNILMKCYQTDRFQSWMEEVMISSAGQCVSNQIWQHIQIYFLAQHRLRTVLFHLMANQGATHKLFFFFKEQNCILKKCWHVRNFKIYINTL